MQHKILMMGPQGSGKGTQAEILSEALNVPAFGMGQLIRDEVSTGSKFGLELKELINQGLLVSDENAAHLLKLRLENPDTQNGYILDGYPRNKDQYKAFDFDTPTHVIVINIPKEESLKRLGGRLTNDQNGKVYSIADGYVEGQQMEEEGTLIVRSDDTPEAIEKRLEIYHNDTSPIIDEYKKNGIVHDIDGVGTVDQIAMRIKEVLEKKYGNDQNPRRN